MALTRNSKRSVVERIERGPDFARAVLDEATAVFLNGEPEIARLLLRDLVNASIGFESLARLTHKSAKSLHRMLSSRGNPSMDNLSEILSAIRKKLRVRLKVQAVRGA